MPRYIPPEITDTIIAAVEHRHTLAMCALVCRDWLPASRTKLFRDIVIDHSLSYALLVERVLHSETMSAYLSSVCSLTILGYLGSVSSATRMFPIEFAGKLQGLRELTLRRMDWTVRVPCAKWPLFLSQFRTITSLSLVGCRFSSFNDLRRMLTVLPLLSSLSIQDPSWSTVSLEPFQQANLRSRAWWPVLHKLYIKCALNRRYDAWRSTETLLKWLTSALRGSAVEELTYWMMFSGGPRIASSLQDTAVAFFTPLGQSVTNLRVTFQVASTNNLPLVEFTALQYLTFESCSKYQGDWKGVALMLQNVSSKRVRSIAFSSVHTRRWVLAVQPATNPENWPYLGHRTLEELDPVLSGEPFGSLEEVAFYPVSSPGEDQDLLYAEVKKLLPKLCERRVVRLHAK
ncbi:hypothetical protein L226DRAFT_47778 [Lentinus tigrinus ALCF2SS1-7]|uniref:uncharacterized protein n=1 Tax=Lentinus tigrinus ALCF2SS1-7 TaxID=1328758 RepID=UPI00116619E4|nr:hypothetical protein L226DRAFT_47778 [Lentinus tigrinus ALCF2SS1-7]